MAVNIHHVFHIILNWVFVAQLAELFIQTGQNAVWVCLDVNQGGTDSNRCTQRLVNKPHPSTVMVTVTEKFH